MEFIYVHVHFVNWPTNSDTLFCTLAVMWPNVIGCFPDADDPEPMAEGSAHLEPTQEEMERERLTARAEQVRVVPVVLCSRYLPITADDCQSLLTIANNCWC